MQISAKFSAKENIIHKINSKKFYITFVLLMAEKRYRRYRLNTEKRLWAVIICSIKNARYSGVLNLSFATVKLSL